MLPKLLLKEVPKVPKPAAPIDAKLKQDFHVQSYLQTMTAPNEPAATPSTPNPSPQIIADKINGTTIAPTNPITNAPEVPVIQGSFQISLTEGRCSLLTNVEYKTIANNFSSDTIVIFAIGNLLKKVSMSGNP